MTQRLDLESLRLGALQFYARQPKPFVSWAGSKRRLLPQIVEHLPTSFTTYIEPFLGGGSLALLLRPNHAVLSDSCEPLIGAWLAIREDPDRVFQLASSWSLDRQTFYEVRNRVPLDDIEAGARFVYLNRGAFNGLWRVNKKGEFNVPWGAPKTSFVGEASNFAAVSSFLNRPGVKTQVGDFEVAINTAADSDLLFLDPPYASSHVGGGFVDYNATIFSWADQQRLALAAEAARTRGAHVMVTNADHPAIEALYPNFARVTLERASTLAASSSKRGRATEVLWVGKPRNSGQVGT